LSQEAGDVVKKQGKDNDLVQRIVNCPYFQPIHDQLEALLNPSTFIGRAPEQVEEFLQEEVRPVLSKYPNLDISNVELKV